MKSTIEAPDRRVMVFGCFDLLHLGHPFFFERAKRFGGENASLTVVVARDANAERAKGRKPLFDERERLALVSALRVVDKAVLGGEKDLFAVVRRLKPDVIVLGFDQSVNEALLRAKIREFGLNTRVLRLRSAFQPAKHKSGILRRFLGL